MFLPNPEVTRRAIEELHAEGVPAGGVYDSKVRDWHIYTYWDHIIEKKSVAADGLPWSAVPRGGVAEVLARHVPPDPGPAGPLRAH